MSLLATRYLGLSLKSPLIVSSNPLNYQVDNIVAMAEAGAGAVILPSLFEEQIRLEDSGFDLYRPEIERDPPKDLQYVANRQEEEKRSGIYLSILHQAKKKTDIKILASLNGRSKGGWVRYARLFEATGADALELNIYALPSKPHIRGAEIEENYIRLVKEVCATVNIPVSVKLSPYFSSLPHMAKRLTEAGAAGLVFFNRFYQPNFDLDNLTVAPDLELSSPAELLLRLRWTAILYQQIEAELAVTGGLHHAPQLIKSILAGAQVGMVTSAVLKHGIDHISTILSDLEAWMIEHEYESVAAMRGLLSQQKVPNPGAFERANYMQVLHSYAGE